jgi:hypothetical protein
MCIPLAVRSGTEIPEAMTDYRNACLDALEECDMTDTAPLTRFLEYSYLETLERISGYFRIINRDPIAMRD